MLKRISTIAILLFVVLPLTGCALASDWTPYNSFTLSGWGDTVAAPNGYVPQKVWNGFQMGAGHFNKPNDLFVDKVNHELYLADTGNARIVVFNKDMRFMREYKQLSDGTAFVSPKGVFVREDGVIYVADDGLGQVIMMDGQGNILALYSRPQSDLYDETLVFLPQKVVADRSGRVYVLSQGVYQGLLCYHNDGTFLNFHGGNHVEPTLKMFIQKLWRMVLTREQRAAVESFIPIEYSNIAIDAEDFIYATVAAGDNERGLFLRKLNPKGINVLPKLIMGGLLLTDVAVGEHGLVTLLDKSMGLAIQIHEDSADGMYNFGGLGNQMGLYKDPVAMIEFNNDMLVLDREKGMITVFSLTEFGTLVREATALYNEGLYIERITPWKEVLRMNANYVSAYAGLGKAYYQLQEYVTAMDYFRLGNLKELYSQAFRAHSLEIVRAWLGYVILGVVIIYAFVKVTRYINRRRGKPKRIRSLASNEWTYPLYCVRHPFRGFEDVKFLRKGSLRQGFLILALLPIALIIQRQETGFIFNMNQPEKLNVPLMVLISVGGFMIWFLSSMAVSSLMNDCEGRTRELFLVGTYTLLPVIMGVLVSTLVSNFISLDMEIFLTFFSVIMFMWAAAVHLIGLYMVNQIAFGKTILNAFLSVISMGIILCLCVLAFSLLQQVYIFVLTIVNEMIFRM